MVNRDTLLDTKRKRKATRTEQRTKNLLHRFRLRLETKKCGVRKENHFYFEVGS